MELIKTYRNILDLGLGKIEKYDFSTANYNLNTRIETITTVASVCFGKDKSKKPEALYQRLIKESMGLPSSSFEFVPILLSTDKLDEIEAFVCEHKDELKDDYLDFLKFGTFIEDDRYLLTNLRALISTIGVEKSQDYLNNTEEERKIIEDNYFVYKVECDIVTARQWMRHRVGNYNEKSRRYTKDLPEIYTPIPLGKVITEDIFGNMYDVENYIKLSLDMYSNALKQVSAQEARYLLPLGLMTTFWVGGTKRYWENFLKLRTDKHSQDEIKAYATSINDDLRLV